VTQCQRVTVPNISNQRGGFIFSGRYTEFLHWTMRALNIIQPWFNV
jgi:hypothetical protein